MAFMKFYVGTEASIQEHLDGIYLATDTHKIFYNGSAYGGSEVDLSNYLTKDYLKGYTLYGSNTGTVDDKSSVIIKLIYNDRERCNGRFAILSRGENYTADQASVLIKNQYGGNSYGGYAAGGVYFTAGGVYSGNKGTYVNPRIVVGELIYTEQWGTDAVNSLGYPNNWGNRSILSKNKLDFITEDNEYPLRIGKVSLSGLEWGISIQDKTSSDLLHAAGGTISIDELKSQLNIPDTSSLQSAIGTNTYTGANYVSKETNLTDAVLQLDEEIKATNDNLALEHTNAEATYAKKTELSNQIEVVQTNVDLTNTRIVNAKLSMASWTSGANANKLTFTGSSVGLGGTPAIFFAQGGITGGGNTIPTQSCIRFEGCHIYQDSNGFYVSLPKASDTSDGVMSGEDHKKLGGILNTTKNWVNEVRNDSIPTLPSSATVYKIMDLPGTAAECRASLYLICVPISSSSDKPRIYYNDETLCYLQPVVNGTYQYATGIMVLPDYSISDIYLGETYDYIDH